MAETLAELREELELLDGRYGHLCMFFELEKRKRRVAELEEKMAQGTFWNSPESSREIIDECSGLKRSVALCEGLRGNLDNLRIYVELLESCSPEEMGKDLADAIRLCEEIKKQMDDAELRAFLCGVRDGSNAIVSIHSGAGGTEACDWADMLLRMYIRWADLRGFQTELQDVQPGEEAGISRASFRIIGTNAYGYAKAERGVHRLVRISPFDSNRRRHTSFCSVDVIAEIEDDMEIDIRDEDLRIDTFRSSGKGGQHVNKTESAIRITHIPTGIVVVCQNERSQQKNRSAAMRTLRARIYNRMEDEKRSSMEKFYGEKGEIGWGNQIRSYVFQPYQMVKDLRTAIETSDVQGVMDGNLDIFINGWLRMGCPSTRKVLANETAAD
ncbi:MAG: peptide chain release factor 2 [Puniceicoccales bacterium]|jgi:peptide chain release factor 2|nr:peptide chain release factor 2 [Puniceicoccales bacterium]